jgi:hypothetical protein
MARNRAWVFVVAVGATLVISVGGCGSADKTYDLSGTVTFQGKPVPAGSILFEPAAGNKGPSGYAKIKDGRYDTRDPDCRGIIGGPHLVQIRGLDGIPRGELLNGVPLFPEHTVTVDLPKENGTRDFEVNSQRGN